MDTFATFLNALQERQQEARRQANLALSEEASEKTESQILVLLMEHPDGLSVDNLRAECSFSFMSLAQALTSLLEQGKVTLSGDAGHEHVRLSSRAGSADAQPS